MEQTLVILKPDAIRRRLVGEIILRLERKEMVITDVKVLTIDRTIAEEHYKHVLRCPPKSSPL